MWQVLKMLTDMQASCCKGAALHASAGLCSRTDTLNRQT